jgi:hypothetical protein
VNQPEPHVAEDCMLQDYIHATRRSPASIRCWYLFGNCRPSHQCDERRSLSADEIALRHAEDAA